MSTKQKRYANISRCNISKQMSISTVIIAEINGWREWGKMLGKIVTSASTGIVYNWQCIMMSNELSFCLKKNLNP